MLDVGERVHGGPILKTTKDYIPVDWRCVSSFRMPLVNN